MTKRKQLRSDSEIETAITQYETATKLLARGLNEEAFEVFSQVINHAPWLIPAFSGAGAAALENGLFQQALDLATEGLRASEERSPHPDVQEELTRQRSILTSQKASALSGLGQ